MTDDLKKPRTRRKAHGPEFGEWLKNAREAKGLTMRGLASVVASEDAEDAEDKIDASTISRLESGERNPSRRMVFRIADALSVNPDDGLRLSGYSTEEERQNVLRRTLPTGDVIEVSPRDPEPQVTADAMAAFMQAWRTNKPLQ